MKTSGVLKKLGLTFLVAIVVYASSYAWIEHRRVRKGPWQVAFITESNAPAILINQPALEIQNVRITFTGEPTPTNAPEAMRFDSPHPWPYPVPFGQCVFMDTTFLPGNVTFELLGHEIQLLPRVLTIDHVEIPWRSNTNIPLSRPHRPDLAPR